MPELPEEAAGDLASDSAADALKHPEDTAGT